MPARVDPDIRFWEKVNKNGPIPEARPDLGPCWLWMAGLDRDGYGRFQLDGRWTKAHQFLLPPIPTGLVPDHLCRNRKCVRPTHLEFVQQSINVLRGASPALSAARQLRKTHCPHGHPYAGNNLQHNRKGARLCRICRVASRR